MLIFAILSILNYPWIMVLLAHINDDNGLEYELDIIYLGHEDLGDGLMFLICIFMASFRIFLDVDAGLIFF